MENIYEEIKVIRHNITRFIAGYLAQKKKKKVSLGYKKYLYYSYFLCIGWYFFSSS
jgi:hypothetical protein